MSALDRFPRRSKRETDLRTEALSGVTTLLTMSCILSVNPGILSAAGVPFDGAATDRGAAREVGMAG